MQENNARGRKFSLSRYPYFSATRAPSAILSSLALLQRFRPRYPHNPRGGNRCVPVMRFLQPPFSRRRSAFPRLPSPASPSAPLPPPPATKPPAISKSPPVSTPPPTSPSSSYTARSPANFAPSSPAPTPPNTRPSSPSTT